MSRQAIYRIIAVICGLSALTRLCGADTALAQDMEPRAYSASPIGTNFLLATYGRITGSDSVDPSLPISNVRASINLGLLGFSRTFELFGDTASAAIVVPYFAGQVSGQVFEQSKLVNRAGLGDMRVRFTDNLIGNPAQTPEEFAKRDPTTTGGMSLTIGAPTGDYDSTHLINIGSHRWAFKPEIGGSQPFGDWFLDGAAGVWLFTENTKFFGGHVRGEDPLWVLQAHGGYNFLPGLWFALDLTHYFGGNTILDHVNKHDFQSVTRGGATLSLPLGQGFQAKVAYSTWLTAHNSGNFDTVLFTLQYRWFDQ